MFWVFIINKCTVGYEFATIYLNTYLQTIRNGLWLPVAEFLNTYLTKPRTYYPDLLCSGTAKVHNTFHTGAHPVVHFYNYTFAIANIGYTQPGAHFILVAGTGKFFLAKNFAAGCSPAIKLIAVPASNTGIQFAAIFFFLCRCHQLYQQK